MDLVKIMQVAWRRWYVVAVGIVVTAIGGLAVLSMPPTYEATSVLVLLPPNTPPAVATPTAGEPAPINPYQAFDGSITITAELMSTQLTQPSVVDALVQAGATPDYTVATDPETGGPTVTITAKTRSASQAIATTRLVSEEFRRRLTERQRAAGAPADSLITASAVVTPAHADKLVSGRNRALVAVAAVGAVISIVAALVVDHIAAARRAKRDDRERRRLGDAAMAESDPFAGQVFEASPWR